MPCMFHNQQLFWWKFYSKKMRWFSENGETPRWTATSTTSSFSAKPSFQYQVLQKWNVLLAQLNGSMFFLLSMMDWCNFIKLFLWYSYWYSLVLAYECSKINLLNSYFYESLILVHSAHLFNFTKNTIRSSK